LTVILTELSDDRLKVNALTKKLSIILFKHMLIRYPPGGQNGKHTLPMRRRNLLSPRWPDTAWLDGRVRRSDI
jgi:hypothetical protein